MGYQSSGKEHDMDNSHPTSKISKDDPKYKLHPSHAHQRKQNHLQRCRQQLLKPRAVAVTSSETSTIDYSSSISVFPMEACEILGGEACNARMFPEAKLAAAAGSGGRPASEEIDRDYLEYNDPKTVFPGEACDDLGGEFCQAEYQNGVF
ncbi:unnamed protein product [Musa acuminata subsp. malaccensis]|uniref:(wild Malaysian banana) hypothetical protein n=1 Tax=Musa acuminata subsp. malaccensis TaxID=214687 RepID=A0A804I0D0_MUSAM|nr:unnamed protein product [Musa acuminata subsp. malaccensis]